MLTPVNMCGYYEASAFSCSPAMDAILTEGQAGNEKEPRQRQTVWLLGRFYFNFESNEEPTCESYHVISHAQIPHFI